MGMFTCTTGAMVVSEQKKSTCSIPSCLKDRLIHICSDPGVISLGPAPATSDTFVLLGATVCSGPILFSRAKAKRMGEVQNSVRRRAQKIQILHPGQFYPQGTTRSYTRT